VANIDLEELFKAKQRSFRTEGSGDIRFERDFTAAVNDATRKINRGADLVTRIGMVATHTETVALSDEYVDILSDLIHIGLIQNGQRPSAGDEVSFQDLARQKKTLVSEIAHDIRNQRQESNTDDTNDIAQLGGLG
jgi:hypothetical protein